MPESEGQHSYGVKAYSAPYDTASPGGDPNVTGFDLLGEVISINGLAMQSTVTRVTHLNSDGKAHEKVPGFLDAGQLTMRFNKTPSLMTALFALLPQADDAYPDWGRKQFVVHIPSQGQFYCTGFVQGAPFEVPEDDRVTVELTVEVSGRPTWTEES